MKFLADMGLARSTVAFLRAQGHDAVHLRDQGLQRLEDEEIIEKARAEGRVILTHDLDFGRIIAVSLTHTVRQETSPCSPMPYWVSDAMQRKFKELPPFEGNGGSVQHRVSTKNDFRQGRLAIGVPGADD
jgi:hypothetical protein